MYEEKRGKKLFSPAAPRPSQPFVLGLVLQGCWVGVGVGWGGGGGGG
jgi:hypothetical protein